MAGLPPLLPGWSEHVSAEGQKYWFNASLQESTYSRPTSQPPGFEVQSSGVGNGTPMYTGPPPPLHASNNFPLAGTSQAGSSAFSDGGATSTKAKTKKEKPAKKEPIPGAVGWLRVTTTLGNIFYTHVETKRSEWTVPDEIKEQVAAMKDEEARVKALEEEEMRLAKEQEEEEKLRLREEERLTKLKEEEEERKKRLEELRIREEAVKRQRQERERIQEERLQILREQSKRKRAEEEEDKKESGGKEEEDQESDKKARLDVQGDDDDEAWQREMAAEMAEEEAAREEALNKTASVSAGPFNVPPPGFQTDPSGAVLTLEEGRALFMHMLTALNGTVEAINPMAPWDKELPKIIHQRDYTVLSSLRDRQDAFNDWCRNRLRELRSKGAKPSINIAEKEVFAAPAASEATDEQNGKLLGQYRSLLEAEVKSTRTKWDDFRRAWKKDRRFFAFGRDDRERERVFRVWLKELGEVKRKEAKKKEEAFVRLLDEKLGSSERLASESSADEVKAAWNRAKRSSELYKDPRYEPVGSSTRRAELFETWSKGQWTRNNDGDGKERKQDVDQSERPSKDAERALRLREEAVELKRRETEMEKRRAYGQATRGESHDSFRQLLVDAIRDPLMTITDAFRTLSSDGRFDAPGLRAADKDNLIQQHIDHLNEKRLRELERVFERHASSLDVEAEIALPLIRNDDEVERRQLDQLEVLVSGRKSMKDLFLDWRDESERQASMAFQQMLKENAFVNFWGRLRQEHKQRQEAAEKGNGAGGAGGGGRQGEDEEDEDDPDLLQMAGNIDLEEIHSILRNDQRYRAFRHRPEQREEWIRVHLQRMSAPKVTVFQRD